MLDVADHIAYPRNLAAPVAGHGCCFLNEALALSSRLIRASAEAQTTIKRFCPAASTIGTRLTPTGWARPLLDRQVPAPAYAVIRSAEPTPITLRFLTPGVYINF